MVSHEQERDQRRTTAARDPARPATLRGLTDDEVVARRRAGEGNTRPPSAGRGYLRIVAEGAFAPVNVVLFAICGVLAWLGLGVDAAVTAVPVLLNVLAGIVLEARAKRQLDRLEILSRPRATVIRAGEERQVAPEDLVLGDLLVIRRGDQVLLDGEVVDGAVELDESLLTGEADAVNRAVGARVLSGSACLGGRAVVRATAVGADSYAASLIVQARTARTDRTPLQRDLDRLVGASAALVVAVAVVVAVDVAGAGQVLTRASVQAAAVLVAIVPQGLVIISTLLYATAAVAISRSGALVQRVTAVETMSRADVLVLDKTGTLTTGRLLLERISLADAPPAESAAAEPVRAERAAVEPAGAQPAEALAVARPLLAAIAAEPAFSDRTTDAIRGWLDLHSAVGAGAGMSEPGPPRLRDRIPFASDRRWSAVVTADETVVLGAPEVLAGDAPAGAGAVASAEAWAAAGLRVLTLGTAPTLEGPPDHRAHPSLPAGLRPVVVLGFQEELRADARETLAALAGAGVSLRIASGDHPATVGAIAAAVGLQPTPAVDARELLGADDGALAGALERTTILGRVEPALKARLVGVLRSRGHQVAMVGDGVNDIIALRSANLGLAMASGSPAARAAADVVLLRDEFSVLPRAITAGQRIVEGMRLVACLLLTRTVYALLLVLATSLTGLEFPITPRTNSLQALLTVGIPSLVLAAWAPPVPARTRLVPSALRFAIPAGLAIAGVGLIVYAVWPRGAGGPTEARTALAVLTTWCGILLIPFLLPPRAGRDRRPTLLAAIIGVAFMVVLLVAPLRELFELDLLTPIEIVVLALIGVAWALVAARVRSLRLVARLLRAVRPRQPA